MKNFTRSLSVSFVMILLATTISAQQVTDGFEKQTFPPAGWKTIHVKGTNSWETSVVNPHTGQKSAFIAYEQINNGFLGEGDNWLILPKVYNVQAGDNLTFFVAAQFQESLGGYFENLEIYVSTTDNSISSFTNSLDPVSMNNYPITYQSVTRSLAAFAGQNIYIAFRNHQNQGVGLFLDDVTVTSKLASDLGSLGINLNNDAIIPTGTTVDIVNTVQNFGTGTLSAGIPVKYTINNGTPVVLSTTASIAPGNTTIVNFTGSNAFTPNTPGDYTLKVFTDNASEINRGNDTIIYKIRVRTPISGFPHFQDFTSMNDWSIAGSGNFQFVDHLNNAGLDYNIVNPAGDKNLAALAFTYSSSGDDYYLRSPLLNFSSISKPVLNFYVAAGRYTPHSDQLQVVVSTDGGVTFDPVPLYSKSEASTSKLVTAEPDKSYFYVPNATNQWRHEIVDLSKYAGNANVMVAFKVTSDGANNVWIDNAEIINQNPSTYTSTRVTAAGQTVTGPYNTLIKFNSIVAIDSVRMEGTDATPVNSTFDANSTSTAPDGSIETPNFVFGRYLTIAYSGNSVTRANYDISIDITGLPGTYDPDKLYILKRSDQTDGWIALPTTRAGNILKSAGLSIFSDFAVGYYSTAVPVTVVSFNGQQQDKLIRLTWNTSQEANIANYEVQHWSGNEWKWLGTVTSQRISMQNRYTFDDVAPTPGINLYRLKITSEIGAVVYSDIAKVQFTSPASKVYQNVPNPFRDQTVIRLDIARQSKVSVLVYNTSGKQIAVLANGDRQPGSYLLTWNAGSIPAGTYFYKVIINDDVQTLTMLKIE